MKKQLLSIFLVLIMIFCIMPSNAIAEDIGSSGFQTENFGKFIDGEQTISDMIEKNGMYAHPRIIMSEEKFSKLKASIGDNSVTATLIDKLRNEADRTLDMPVSQYEIPDGIRLLETSKRIQRRVAALAMAYNILGDEKYAQRCYEELEAACKFKDWNPSHFLDTAEMSTAFALGYDWLYNWMNDEQRYFIKKNMIEKGLTQVMDDYEDRPRTRTYRWYQDYPGDNWKLVCNGGMSMAALAIGDEADARDIASEVLTYAYKESYSFVRRAYSAKDGTYSEGLGYWDYATYYLGLYSSSLTSATGTDYGLADFEGLRKSVDFVRYMSSNTPKSFSFGDDGDSRDTGWAVFLWLGDYLQSYDISAVRLKKIENDSFNYLDLLWIDEDKKSNSAEDSPTDWGEVGASNASFRNTWDESGIVAALHVGTNNYKYHGHYDLGSFYIESNGARFFTDLGNELYELPNREYSYRIRAEGHNTLAINPSKELDQQEGAECLISDFSGGNEAYAITDLTVAYKTSGAESVVRGLKMIKDKECVVIQDEISLNAPGEIYWFAHTKGQIEVADDGRSAVVTVDSEKLWVEIISENGKFTVMKAESLPTSPVVPNQTDNSSYRKLAIHITNTKDTTISVACIPLKQGEIQPLWTPSMKALSEWTSQHFCECSTYMDSNQDGKCDICGYTTNNHTGIFIGQNDATCTAYGVQAYYKCSCGKFYTDSTHTKEITDFDTWKNGDGRIAKKSHSYEASVITEPTCTKEGVTTYTCSGCGDSYTEPIPVTDHICTSTVHAPTYFEQGYTLYECDNCDYSYTDDYTNKLAIAITNPSRSTTAIRINWDKIDAAIGYVIEQFDGENWIQIADITDNATVTYKVTGLNPGTAYKFRMKAYNDSGTSAYTATLTANTQMTAVKGFTSPSRATTAIRLSWTKNAYADGYVIDQYTNSGWIQIADITDPETITYKVTGLKSGTAYKFRMKAYSVTKYDETIYGDKTATLTVNTQASSVTGFDLKSRSSSALRLKWTKNTAVDGYIIEQYIDDEWVQIADIDNYKTTEYKVTGLKASTKYKFRMKSYAVTKYGDKTYSAYTSVLSKTTNPSAVAGLKVKSKAQTAIRLAWSKNTSATGYLIEQYIDGNWVQVAKIEDNATLNYRIDGLKKATTYKFRVRAYNVVGATTLYSDYKTVSGTTNS